MGRSITGIAITLTFGILTLAPAARSPLPDFDACHDDLDRLRRNVSDASDAAEEARSKHEDYEHCRRDSNSLDDCRRKRPDYESALSDLESKMDEVDRRLRSVQTSCDYEFTINRMSDVEASQRRLCASLKKLVALGMTPNDAIQMCRSGTEQSCKACLGLK